MPSKVLLLKPSSFGDIIHTLPAVAWMKKVHPEWSFSWLANTEWTPLLEGNKDLDQIIPFPRREFTGLAGLLRFMHWVQRVRRPVPPDLAVDFQGLLRTAFIARLSRAATTFGLADAREGARWFYHALAEVPGGTPHAVDRYLALAGKVLNMPIKELPRLDFTLPAGSPPACAGELAVGEYILLHPFSRGAGKSLSLEQLELLCDQLGKTAQQVLVGRCGEGASIPISSHRKNLLNSTTVSELIWLVRNARFVLSVDSGPVHLAAALDVPLVALHTWSDPRKVGPYNPSSRIWKNGQIFRFDERHSLGEDFYQQSPRKLLPADLARIASLAWFNAP